MAGALNYLFEHGSDNLTEEDLAQMLRVAITAAYLVTVKRGALRFMPDPERILTYYKSLTPMHKNTQGISAYSVYKL